MPRAISIGSALVALVFLVLVLADATLIDRRPPTVAEVRLSATAGGDRIAEPISSINVVFSEAVRTTTAESRFHIVPVVAGALTWDGPTLIFTPSEPLPGATAFVVSVDPGYVDLAGNVATTGVDEWAFATSGPPRVLATVPEDGALGLAVDSTVELQFDRLMDTASVEGAIVISPRVSFSATWSGPHVSLAFERELAFGTTYSLSLETTAADTAGAHLVAPFTLQFATVSAGLEARVVPAADVAGIAVRSPIAVLFDGPIDLGSAAEALTITPSVGGATEVVSDPNGGPASVLIFRPSSPLAENTTYTVTLAPVVKKFGDPGQVAAGRTWSFTTGSETESAQNQIAFLSDRSGVTNLWLVNPDGTNARQLTWELAPVTAFDVTGDGRRLVYATGDVVATLNVDGSDAQVITEAGDVEGAPRLSPDETKILLARRGVTGADRGWWLVPTPWTFGDERQVLLSGGPAAAGPLSPPQPAFDADGGHALVPLADGSLVVVDLLADGEPAPSSPTGVRAFGPPTWSAFAKAFVVAGMGSESTPVVHRIDIAGHDVALRGIDKINGPIAVDERGRMLVAWSASGAGRGLLLLGPDGGELDDLTIDRSLIDGVATFSPDGQRVVVARSRDDGSGASGGLWLIDLESGTHSQLTIDGSEPRWLP